MAQLNNTTGERFEIRKLNNGKYVVTETDENGKSFPVTEPEDTLAGAAEFKAILIKMRGNNHRSSNSESIEYACLDKKGL